jgi:hypothetical protein
MDAGPPPPLGAGIHFCMPPDPEMSSPVTYEEALLAR